MASPIALATIAAVGAYGASVANKTPPPAPGSPEDSAQKLKDAEAKAAKDKIASDAKIQKLEALVEQVKLDRDRYALRAVANSVPEDAFRKANPEILTTASVGVLADSKIDPTSKAGELIKSTAKALYNRGTIWQLFQRVSQAQGKEVQTSPAAPPGEAADAAAEAVAEAEAVAAPAATPAAVAAPSDTASLLVKAPESTVGDPNSPVASPVASPKSFTPYAFGPYFEPQEGLGCGRHALNNLFGKKLFVAGTHADAGKITFSPPFSLHALCEAVEAKVENLGGEPEPCLNEENYDITTLQQGLKFAGFTGEAKNVTTVKDALTPNTVGLIVNLGPADWKDANGVTQTTSKHWIAVRHIGEDLWVEKDSLEGKLEREVSGPPAQTAGESLDSILTRHKGAIQSILVVKPMTTEERTEFLSEKQKLAQFEELNALKQAKVTQKGIEAMKTDAEKKADELNAAAAAAARAAAQKGGAATDSYDEFANLWYKHITEALQGVEGKKEDKKKQAAQDKEDGIASNAAAALVRSIEKAINSVDLKRRPIDVTFAALGLPSSSEASMAKAKLDLLVYKGGELNGLLGGVRSQKEYNDVLEKYNGALVSPMRMKDAIEEAFAEYEAAVKAATPAGPGFAARLFGRTDRVAPAPVVAAPVVAAPAAPPMAGIPPPPPLPSFTTLFSPPTPVAAADGIHRDIITTTPKSIAKIEDAIAKLDAKINEANTARTELCTRGGDLPDYEGGPEAYKAVTEHMQDGEAALNAANMVLSDFKKFLADYTAKSRGISVLDSSFELTASEKAANDAEEARLQAEEQYILDQQTAYERGVKVAPLMAKVKASREASAKAAAAAAAQPPPPPGPPPPPPPPPPPQSGGVMSDFLALRETYNKLREEEIKVLANIADITLSKLTDDITTLQEVRNKGPMTPDEKRREETKRLARGVPLPKECTPFIRGVAAPAAPAAPAKPVDVAPLRQYQAPSSLSTRPGRRGTSSSSPPATVATVTDPAVAAAAAAAARKPQGLNVGDNIPGTTLGIPGLGQMARAQVTPKANSTRGTVRASATGGARKRTLRTLRGVNKRKNVRGSRRRKNRSDRTHKNSR